MVLWQTVSISLANSIQSELVYYGRSLMYTKIVCRSRLHRRKLGPGSNKSTTACCLLVVKNKFKKSLPFRTHWHNYPKLWEPTFNFQQTQTIHACIIHTQVRSRRQIRLKGEYFWKRGSKVADFTELCWHSDSGDDSLLICSGKLQNSCPYCLRFGSY